MENFTVTRFQLTIDADNLKGISGPTLKSYIDGSVCPVIFDHLTIKPKDGGDVRGEIRCTADRGGVRCEGSVSGSIHL